MPQVNKEFQSDVTKRLFSDQIGQFQTSTKAKQQEQSQSQSVSNMETKTAITKVSLIVYFNTLGKISRAGHCTGNS